MRLNINLASQKYEDVRRFYVRWSAIIAGVAVLTLVLSMLVWMKHSSSAMWNNRIHERERKVDSLEKKRAEVEDILRRPENHDITAQKNYWNRQISRRLFSWTQLFNDLQRIMPARAYVSSVRPETTPDNRVKLTILLVGDTHDNGLELQKKMEKSERFHSPWIKEETPQVDQRTGARSYKFDIETFYTPTAEPSAHPSSREGL